jgi:uncharacterized protein HemY
MAFMQLSHLAESHADQAEAELRKLRSRMLMTASSHPRLMSLLARLCAARGDWDQFTRLTSSLLDAGSVRSLQIRVADVGLLFEPGRAGQPPASGAQVLATLRKLIDQRMATSPRSGDTASRVECLLGNWCVHNGMQAQAEASLTRATEFAGKRVECRLWIADLSRILGKHEAAQAVEIQLLREHALPPARVAQLLAELKQDGNSQTAQLADKAAKYCRLPNSAGEPGR